MEPLIMIALLIGAFWLMSSRTRKQQREAMAFRDTLAPGQEVMTVSGLFGTVVAVDDDVVTLETSPGVTTRWTKRAIGQLVPPVADEDDEQDGVDDATGAGATPVVLVKKPDEDVDVPDDASSLTDDPPGDSRR